MNEGFDVSGGWASRMAVQRAGLSYVSADGRHASTAIADMWAPPHRMALPADVCDYVIEHALEHEDAGIVPEAMGNYTFAPTTREGVTAWVLAVTREPGTDRPDPMEGLIPEPLDADVVGYVVARLKAANAAWWGLDLDMFSIVVKRYTEGGHHPAHTDWQPGSLNSKLASSFQLSAPGDYEGGDLHVYRPGHPVMKPRAHRERGSVVMFPCWTMHEVLPVTSGTRWVMIADGWGPRLR